MLIILGIYSLMVTVIAIALKQISSKSLSKYLEEIDYLKEKNCILSRRIQDCSHQLCDKTKEIIELRDVRDLLEKKIKDQDGHISFNKNLLHTVEEAVRERDMSKQDLSDAKVKLRECRDKISNLTKQVEELKKNKKSKVRRIKCNKNK